MKKHYIKKLFATVAVLLCCTTANAHDFEVDGIYYKILSASDLTAQVTYKGNSYDEFTDEYSGEVIIPSTVSYTLPSFLIGREKRHWEVLSNENSSHIRNTYRYHRRFRCGNVCT